jgi:hypothetical protein
MQLQSKLFVGAVAVTAVMASVASAARFAITPVVSAAFTDDTFGTELPAIPDLSQPGTPQNLRVDFNITFDNAGANERGFGNIAFDVNMTPGVMDAFGWVPNTAMEPLPPPGPAGDQPIFSVNADTGAADLKNIVVSTASGVPGTGMRGMVGKPGGPNLLGQLFVKWNGAANSNLVADILGASVQNDAGQLQDVTQTAMMVDGTLPLGGGGVEPVVPVVVDADLGDRIRGAIISHAFMTSAGDLPITWGGLQLTSGPTPASQPTINSTGQFSWASHNSPFGTYVFTVQATNAAGNDTGTLTVELIVPEPATLSLVGLAMIGLVGLMRRRS